MLRDSLSESLSVAIKEASAPHHGFRASDMPSHALVLISRHYFPGLSADNLGIGVESAITGATGCDFIEVASAVVDEISPRHPGVKGVSLLLLSQSEDASIHVFHDSVNRDISLGRAWKSQGHGKNQETLDDGHLPASGDWKSLLSGDVAATPPSSATATAPGTSSSLASTEEVFNNVQSAIIVTKPSFSAMDWPAQLFPRAVKVGLVPSSTPFLTGLPFTLTHRKTVLKDAGIAIAFGELDRKKRTARVSHPSLKPLGQPLSGTK